ncbi:MAG: hypothetical protein P1Q69_13195 [Candidatus Thorarchaeota archaeon]|nr:hypothetical protein [Candidatus Thorarchaeota archaeon]
MKHFAPFFEQKRSEIRKQRQGIQLTLKDGPASVTQIAKKTDFEKDLIVWNLIGLLKWGKIEVVGEENHELVYGLKEV